MKILHTADWHLGKNLHGESLISEQKHALEQIVQIAQDEQVDAVIIAGDLYDKPVPSIEATKLLEETLQKLNVEMGLPVLAISGNHDSASRLAYGSSWYAKNGLHIAGGLKKDLEVVTIGDTQFWFVPYHDVQTARYIFEDNSIKNVDEAMQKVVEIINHNADITKKQVIIAHAFVAGGLMSDSERSLSIGNVERVSLPALEQFNYVALGHLHNPNAINHPTIHYSGSPVKYSFSESNQDKLVKIIEVGEVGAGATVKECKLQPLKDVREIEGNLDDLLAKPQEPVDDFLKITLLDEGALLDPIGKLRQVYPNVLHLERKHHQLQETEREQFETLRKRDDNEIFAQFFEYVNGKDLSTSQSELIQEVLVDVQRGEK